MPGLETWTAEAAAEAVRRGALTSEALVGACLERIRDHDGDVGAWAHLDPDRALAEAQAVDAAVAAGRDPGLLAGIPVGIKDIIDTADLPTECGTPILAGRRPDRDAEVVRRLKRAGAVVLGKTVTTELAFFGPGKTRNPRDLERTPGGSSSGSAAAVADCQVPLALGTQTAGSIIRPASYCGVVGFKPSFGSVPTDGVLAQSPPLDTIGGYGRTVGDVRLLVASMWDPPPGGLPREEPRADGRKKERRLRLAFVRSPAWAMGEAAMQRSFERFAALHADIVAEAALPPDFDDTGGLQRQVQFRDIAVAYGPYLDRHPDLVSAKLGEVIATGRTVSDAEYEAACRRREPLYGSLASLLASCDAILTPAATGAAPLGLASTGSPAFNFLWTYLGMPALSLPLMTVDGLPLGVQLVAARGHDLGLLEVGERLGRALAQA